MKPDLLGMELRVPDIYSSSITHMPPVVIINPGWYHYYTTLSIPIISNAI